MAASAVTSPPIQPERVNILGFPLDRVTIEETKSLFESYLDSNEAKTKIVKVSKAFEKNVSKIKDQKLKRALFEIITLVQQVPTCGEYPNLRS